jgi:hypothetical protein
MKELTPSTIENLPAAILIVSMDDPLPWIGTHASSVFAPLYM